MRFVRPKKKDIFLALALYVLNVSDALFTLHFVSNGAGELNPAMEFLLSLGSIHFLAFKIVVVGALTVLLLFLPLSSRVNNALLFFSGVYGLLVMMHILAALR